MSIQTFPELTRLLGLIHSGSADDSAEAIRDFALTAAPSGAEELSEYRKRLEQALVEARAAHANVKQDLARLGAAQLFSSVYQAETSVLEQSTPMGVIHRTA